MVSSTKEPTSIAVYNADTLLSTITSVNDESNVSVFVRPLTNVHVNGELILQSSTVFSVFYINQWLPDNCAPYVIIYTGAQLSGPGAQLSGSGAQLSAILVCIPTYVISAPLCMYVRYCSSIYMSQTKA